MFNFRERILSELGQIKGSGKFATIGTTPFVLPGLEINGIGEIGFPIQENQIELLKQKAKLSPFGKGADTVYDEEVRKGKEIDASEIQFKNPGWTTHLNSILNSVKKDLGLEDYEIEAQPYKLLIYEEGDFFLTHKDTEKENGMFGTLIISLPSTYSGGQLNIRFQDEEVVSDFSGLKYELGYTAFYADCDHEVLPVTEGYRIGITYNLIHKEDNSILSINHLSQPQKRLKNIFQEWQKHRDEKVYVILLDHQYTPTNFSFDRLKLHDRNKAAVILKAAKDVDLYAQLCLVTSYKVGSPVYGSYDGKYADWDEIDEIIDEWMEIQSWEKNSLPNFGHLSIDQEMLITSLQLDDEEPFERENSGYMGNYGPDVEYWYYFGAIVLCSKETLFTILKGKEPNLLLNWLAYLVQKENLNELDYRLATFLLEECMLVKNTSFKSKEADYQIVAQWLMKNQDYQYFMNSTLEQLIFYFQKLDEDYWLQLLKHTSPDSLRAILSRLAEVSDITIFTKWMKLVLVLNQHGDLKDLASAMAEQMLPMSLKFPATDFLIMNENTLSNLSQIAHSVNHIPNIWHQEMAERIGTELHRGFIHKKLFPLLFKTSFHSQLTKQLTHMGKIFLEESIKIKPEAPKDWRLPMPTMKHAPKAWAILQPFIESPTISTYDYKAIKSDRELMEEAILSAPIDLKMETIRKGSPHTLRITKTHGHYHRALKKWEEDKDLLERITKELMHME